MRSKLGRPPFLSMVLRPLLVLQPLLSVVGVVTMLGIPALSAQIQRRLLDIAPLFSPFGESSQLLSVIEVTRLLWV